MKDLIWIVITGFVLGVFSRALMPKAGRAGMVMPELAGVVGAITLTFVLQLLGWYRGSGNGSTGVLLTAFIGAGAVLAWYVLTVRRDALRLNAR